MKYFDHARNDREGSILLITLMIMASLTIIGIVSIGTSITELQVGNNERRVREAFYLAESAVMEGVQRMAALTREELNEQLVFWRHPFERVRSEGLNFRDPGTWKADGGGEDNALVSALSTRTFIAAVEWTVATGGSLIQTDSRLYQNRIYGLCTLDGSDQLIEIGYYLRY